VVQVVYYGMYTPVAQANASLCANDNETNYPVKFRLRAT
jgi:hypothetical protein